jgi:hypothetical protein
MSENDGKQLSPNLERIAIDRYLERIALALEKQNKRREEIDAKLSQAIDQITNMMSLVATHMVGIQGHES